MKFAALWIVAFEVRSVDLCLFKIARFTANHIGERQRRFETAYSLNLQLDDHPIFMICPPASFRFPAISHVNTFEGQHQVVKLW